MRRALVQSKNCERLYENWLRQLIYIWNEQSVPPMDITYVCIILEGNIKKIKIEFI